MKKNFFLFLRIMRLAWSIRRNAMIAYMIGAIVQTAASLLTIYASAQVASLLAHYVHGQSSSKIWFWLAVDVSAAVIMGLSFWLMNHAKRLIYFRSCTWATNEYFRALCTIDLPDFYDDETRNQINKASNGYSWQLPNLIETCLDLVYAFIRFIAMAVVVAQITWWLIPLVALFLVPSLISESRLAQVQWFVWDTKGDDRHIFWKLDWLVRQPASQFELRTLQARKYVRDRIANMNLSFYKEQERLYVRLSRITVPSKISDSFGVAIGSVVLIRQFIGGAISFDRYLFLSGALLRIVGELNNIFGTLTRIQEPMLFAENFFSLIDRKPTHVDKTDAIRVPAGVPKIEFQDVSFTYPGQTEPVFSNMNLVINPGEHIAIVGENGAGKSTLIKLIMRFYKPDSGVILINDIPLEDIAIESWYEQLSTLFQTFNQYPLPIDENIEIGRPSSKADEKMLKEAAKLSGVTDIVKDYKYGWDTVLDSSFKKGIEPSGGQWQRIALGRAFYRNANLLILDEPTAAIDARAEYDIFNNIFDYYQERSVIIISHRFSTVRRADKIIVVDGGKIIEQGTHKALMKHKGLYFDLFTKQAEGYKN